MFVAAVAASMSRDGYATPPSRGGHTTPPRMHRTKPGELLLDDHETLVVHFLSGVSFELDSKARREAGVASTASVRRFVAGEIEVMPCQICLLDGLQLLTNSDPIFRSPLSVVVAPGEAEQHVGVRPGRLQF